MGVGYSQISTISLSFYFFSLEMKKKSLDRSFCLLSTHVIVLDAKNIWTVHLQGGII